MSRRRQREVDAVERRLASILPDEIRENFTDDDIEKTWDLLAGVFKLNKAKWKALFEDQFKSTSREYSKVEIFARFGRQYLEDSLCVILYRDVQKSFTWFRILRYIVKDKIEAKKKQEHLYKNQHPYPRHKH